MYLDDLRSRQEAVKRGGKDAIRYSQAAYGALQKEGYNVFENEQARNIANQVVSDAIDKKYDQKFAKQVQSASKRFDAITRYDDMLGISSNPYQKVSQSTTCLLRVVKHLLSTRRIRRSNGIKTKVS